MSHVFPLRKTLPALRRLALVAAIGAALITGAAADEKNYTCGTISDAELIVAAHPAYVAHVVLTGDEAMRGVRLANPDVPELDAGVLVLRAGRALVLIAFKADGGCGSMVISPENAEQAWRAIRGTNS